MGPMIIRVTILHQSLSPENFLYYSQPPPQISKDMEKVTCCSLSKKKELILGPCNVSDFVLKKKVVYFSFLTIMM